MSTSSEQYTDQVRASAGGAQRLQTTQSFPSEKCSKRVNFPPYTIRYSLRLIWLDVIPLATTLSNMKECYAIGGYFLSEAAK